MTVGTPKIAPRTLRDDIAIYAMRSLLGAAPSTVAAFLAERAYEIADAMLEERAKS